MTRVTRLIHNAGKYLLISIYPLPTHPTHNFTHKNGGNLDTLPGWPKNWITIDLRGAQVNKSVLVQVMAWCHQVPSHYLSQYWLRSLLPYGVTRPQCVYSFHTAFHSFLESHDDVMRWKHFPHYWPLMREIHRWPVNSPYKDQWCRALMCSLICAWINSQVNNHGAGDLRCHCTH